MQGRTVVRRAKHGDRGVAWLDGVAKYGDAESRGRHAVTETDGWRCREVLPNAGTDGWKAEPNAGTDGWKAEPNTGMDGWKAEPNAQTDGLGCAVRSAVTRGYSLSPLWGLHVTCWLKVSEEVSIEGDVVALKESLKLFGERLVLMMPSLVLDVRCHLGLLRNADTEDAVALLPTEPARVVLADPS